MAEAIGDGLGREGVPYELFHMGNSDRNDVVTKIFEAKAVVVGSPTVNRGLLPTIMPIMEELQGPSIQEQDRRRLRLLRLERRIPLNHRKAARRERGHPRQQGREGPVDPFR